MIYPTLGFWLRFLKITVLIIFLLYAVDTLFGIFEAISKGNYFFNDFFGIWSFSRFTEGGHVSSMYDNSIIQDFQTDLGMRRETFPYAYPPSFLLLIMPFRFMPYHMAYGVWVVVTFAIYAIASLYKEVRGWYGALIIIFAPVTVVTITTGQTGLLTSGLIVGGFSLIRNRPIAAGIALGLASFKPQFGLLIPIALISARQWWTLASAVVTIFVLVVASSIAFGWSIWPIWLLKLPAHAEWVTGVPDRFKPTILATATSLGVNNAVAWGIQTCVAVVVAVLTWMCFRNGVTIPASGALYAGTFLATPYAFSYDLPMVMNAVLAVPLRRPQTRGFWMVAEPFIRVLLPLLSLIIVSWRLSTIRIIPLIIIYGLIVWRILKGQGNIERWQALSKDANK